MKRQNAAVFSILFFLSLTAIFFNQSRPILLFRQYLNETLRPFEITASYGKKYFNFWSDVFFRSKNISEQNADLMRENLELYGRLAELFVVKEENGLLKERLNLSENGRRLLAAEIIGRDYQNNRSFLINKGQKDSLVSDMIVIGYGNSAVGKLTDVGPNTSRVQTIFDVSSRIGAVTLDSGIPGLVKGLGTDFVFDLIMKDRVPKSGEIIISSGTDGIWPRGIVIGKIFEIKSGENQVFNSAAVSSLLDWPRLYGVFVILK